MAVQKDYPKEAEEVKERGKKINSIYSKILAQARVLEAIRLSTNEKRRVELNEIK